MEKQLRGLGEPGWWKASHWMSKFISGKVRVRSKVSKAPSASPSLRSLCLPRFFWTRLCPSPLGSVLWGFCSSPRWAKSTAGPGDLEIRAFLGGSGRPIGYIVQFLFYYCGKIYINIKCTVLITFKCLVQWH